MKNMLNNQKGISLIETVASILLLAILFISFSGFFVNAAKFNASNDNQIQASSVARTYSSNINNYLVNDSEFTLTSLSEKDVYVKTEKQGEYFVKISINKDPEVTPNVKYTNELRKSLIEVWKYVDNNISSYEDKFPVAKSFAYYERGIMK